LPPIVVHRLKIVMMVVDLVVAYKAEAVAIRMDLIHKPEVVTMEMEGHQAAVDLVVFLAVVLVLIFRVDQIKIMATVVEEVKLTIYKINHRSYS